MPVNGTRIFIDQPGPQNSMVTGVTRFSGWAINDNAALNTVGIFVDGTLEGNATYGANRPDVCVAYPERPNCPNVGWMFTLDTTQLADGVHTLTVAAGVDRPNVASSIGSVSTSFTVANWSTANPMRITIDAPTAQSTLSGVVNVGGWSIEDVAAISGVSISVDGVPAGAAVYGATRTDVCNAFPNRPGCPDVGWNFALDTTTLADGIHTLDVIATSSGGQHTTAATVFTVANLAGSALKMYIDIPNPWSGAFSGLAAFGGWAVDDQAAIASVTISVDGLAVGTASYGASRSDVCTVFPGRQGCPNVGWNYSLDTTRYANGTHTLDVTVMAANGDRATQSQIFPVSN